MALFNRTFRPQSIERSKSTISKAHKLHFNLWLEMDINVIEDLMVYSNSGIQFGFNLDTIYRRSEKFRCHGTETNFSIHQ